MPTGLDSHARHVVGLLSSPSRPAEVSEKVQRLVHSRQVGVRQGVHEQGKQGVGVQRLVRPLIATKTKNKTIYEDKLAKHETYRVRERVGEAEGGGGGGCSLSAKYCECPLLKKKNSHEKKRLRFPRKIIRTTG